jgi:hypothetical protein
LTQRFLPLLAVASLCSSARAGYDMVNSFSASSAHTPPFNLGFGGAVWTFSGPLNQFSTVNGFTGGFQAWNWSLDGNVVVAKTSNTDAYTDASGNALPRNQIFVHPAITGMATIIRFDGVDGPFQVAVQTWRPSGNGNGVFSYRRWWNPGFFFDSVYLPPGSARTYPRSYVVQQDPANGNSSIFGLELAEPYENNSYDATCVNMSAVSTSTGFPRIWGSVWLEDWEGRTEHVDMAVSVRNAIQVVTATSNNQFLYSTGQFDLPLTLTQGPLDNSGYIVYLKPRGFLTRKLVPVPFFWNTGSIDSLGVQPQPGSAKVTVFKNGDIDNDDEISILDYLLLSTYLGVKRSDSIPFWNAIDSATNERPRSADIDGDDEVSILDYLILSANYGLQGDQ